jgi:hypothetical protein
MLVYYSIRVHAGEPAFYAKAGDKVHFGQVIKQVVIYTRIISPGGSIIKVHCCDANAFMHYNRLFHVIPVPGGNSDTVRLSLMEYLLVKSELST